MIPSANSTGDLSWHTDNWTDHPGAAAAAAVATAYNSSVSSSSATPATDQSRYLALHRHQILDWENAMLLAHHSNTTTATNSHESVYDQVAEYNKAAGITAMQADALASLSHPRHYEDLLSTHMASNSGSFTNSNAWGLLNTVCSRSSGSNLQQEASLLQTAGAQYSYENLNGADGLGAYGSLAAATATGLYADSLRSSGNSSIGLTSFDQRRLDDIMKRELYTTHDLNSRLGLNLGGRTYFSADDFAFGRWGKRLRPNSPGCMMQPAPLCQAEGCKADLSMAKHYHRRHKVCEYHSKAATVRIGEQTQRFCQQCSRFHVLDEFDDGKRSCRKRLADHNRRRRKPQPTPTTTSAHAADASNIAGDASADQPLKEPSQEATTGSESLQTGAQSCKGSPPPAAEDQPKTASTSTPAASSVGNNNEASSYKNASEQEKLQKHDQSKATATSTKSPLTSTGNHQLMEMTIASPGTNHLVANLSLGGAIDILDVKPATRINSASIIVSHEGSPFENSLSASKNAAVMPWLQGSKKHQNIHGLPYDESTRAATGEGGDHPQYARLKSMSSADLKERNTHGSWMIKEMVGEPERDTDTLLMTSRYAGGSKSGEPGGHELLRLLGDERELLSPTNKHTAMQANPGNSIGTLAFLDHSLDQSGFAKSDQHRMLHFSNLHNPDAEHQAAMSLNRGSSPRNIAFDSHSHNHNYNHNQMM